MAHTTASSVQFFDLDPFWLTVRHACWLDAVATPGLGIQDDRLADIVPELFDLLPGGEPYITTAGQDVMPVVLERYESIAEHAHPEHTLVAYVAMGDDPASIVYWDGNEKRYHTPKIGQAIYLPPHTPHAVLESTDPVPRISLAVRRLAVV